VQKVLLLGAAGFEQVAALLPSQTKMLQPFERQLDFGFPIKKARFFGQPANLETKTAEFLRLRDAYIAQGRPGIATLEARVGSFNTATFVAFLEKQAMEVVGSVILLDNVAFHLPLQSLRPRTWRACHRLPSAVMVSLQQPYPIRSVIVIVIDRPVGQFMLMLMPWQRMLTPPPRIPPPPTWRMPQESTAP
jgi:hypothetical protein